MNSDQLGHSESSPAPHNAEQASSSDLLKAEHVVVEYRDGFRAVDDISFVVPKASVIGVVGESGSGKTSLAMAVTGLIPSKSGTLEFLGRNLLSESREQIRKLRADVQLVFQNPHGSLDPRQKVRAGFRELRRIRPDRTKWIDDDELMRKVHLDPDLLDRYPHQLSGGQAQRVCIARALIFRPQLIVADEPTSGLDVSVQALILQLLTELRDEQQLSILFISHDLSVVRRLCTYMYVMKNGVVVEQGSIEKVFRKPESDYTRQLLDAVPGRERVAEVERG